MRNPPLVLIIDDDKDISEIIAAKLGSAGFETAAASTAEEGVLEAGELLPDLILMDVHLGSGPPGTEVAITIKENPATQNIKIAFLTNLKDPFPGMAGKKGDIARELGMDDFLDKTSDLDVLVDRVREILGLNSAPPADSLPAEPAESAGVQASSPNAGDSGGAEPPFPPAA